MTTVADRGALYRALGALVEAPAPEHARLAQLLGLPEAPTAADHTTLFLLNLYPYASVHLGRQGMLGGEARDRVAGFWRALGMTPPAEPDHLGALLGLLAALVERESEETDAARVALLRQARAALLWEHLLPWLPPFLQRVEEQGGTFYGTWARLLSQALAEAWEEARGDEAPPLPVHLADLPPLPDPRGEGEGGGRAFLEALLAPGRCGMILTRHDLARAGREMGLGIRLGERAYVLKALMAQDAGATLRWLSEEAERAAHAHAALPHDPVITTFWRDRARTASTLLGELASTEAHHTWTPEAGDATTTEAHHG